MMGNPSHGGRGDLAPASSPLGLLVLDLNEQAKLLTEYFRVNGYPEPSFERHRPLSSLPPQASTEMRITREKLLDDALQIFQLISGPGEYLPNATVSVGSSDQQH
jgi:6-hydroxytryprostatin B O-methyltransferase